MSAETTIVATSGDDVALNISALLEECYAIAENSDSSRLAEDSSRVLAPELIQDCLTLAHISHAGRGVLLTLAAVKAVRPKQNISRHKADFAGGFSARSVDAKATVPFLIRHSLPKSTESHWLTQTFSMAGPFESSLHLKTVPKAVGPLLINLVGVLQRQPEAARQIVILILAAFIDIRNGSKLPLTRPKGLTIDQVVNLLERHFTRKYSKNAPRLPQLALYGMYQCFCSSVGRYRDCVLSPLERMKAANRKSGTVGDIDVTKDGRPIEAVEVKLDIPITIADVSEAIEKVRYASVDRYLILSTAGVHAAEHDDIDELRHRFRLDNGCEVIVGGVYDTFHYCLRLLPSTNDFVARYAELMEDDPDLEREHRIAWNELCATLSEHGPQQVAEA